VREQANNGLGEMMKKRPMRPRRFMLYRPVRQTEVFGALGLLAPRFFRRVVAAALLSPQLGK